MTRDELLRVEAERWGQIAALFERVGDRWEEPGANEDWTPRDVLAHIAAWHEIATDWFIGSRRTGDAEAPWAPWGEDLDAYNASLFEKMAGIPVAEVRARASRAREAFVDEVRALPAACGDRQVRITIGNGHGHYEDHIPDLARFVERA